MFPPCGSQESVIRREHLCQLSHLHNWGFGFEITVVRRKGSDLFSTVSPCLSVDKLLFHFVFSFLDPDSLFRCLILLRISQSLKGQVIHFSINVLCCMLMT